MPKLSIITINRNNAEGLRKTIESVVCQTFTDFEYIVIDGASTDESVDIIKQYADRITYWVSEPDKGIYNAMNKGIKKASGDYLQFLNSGDWLVRTNTLSEIFSLNRDEDILYGDEFLYFSEHKIQTKTYPEKISFTHLLNGSISHEGSFYNRNLFNQLYDESFTIVSDWEFEIREIIQNNRTLYKLNQPVIYFEMSGISQSDSHKIIQQQERLKVLDKYIPARILADYRYFGTLEKTTNYSLYPYVEIFSQNPELQRIVRGFMKLLLKLSGKSHLIPRK